jgi:CheY-like chemotaxis protein/nitrogen-specific signal transduction histidine kinase
VFTGYIGSCFDITDRKDLEARQAAAREAAESANRLKDQFLATLSHELRTPLNAILGYARMLRNDVIAPEKRARAIEIIERNAVAQTQLVEDLLDISRVTTARLRLDPRPISAIAPLREALESVRPAAEAKGIVVDLDVDGPACTVNGDGSRLRQVFWNLVSNAVKFTPPGGRVSVSVEHEDSFVVLTIRDSGIGISPEFLPHVFEPFRQADGRITREQGGLGLGLAICKQLVELHGGLISASSDGVGHGALFRVRLPVHQTSIDEPDVQRSRQRVAPLADALGLGSHAEHSLNGIDVLVVDDQQDTLDMLRQLLEHAGAKVRTAATATDALTQWKLHEPDLLVADIGLPFMDGYELLRELRAHSSLSGRIVPALAVTAHAMDADRAKAMAAGFQGHVAKPVDPDAFIAATAAIARQHT